MRIAALLLPEMVAAFLALTPRADAQTAARPAPTAEDWAAVAKLPDLTGVWETPLGGGRNAAGRGGAPAGRAGRGTPAAPSLTPAYAAKAKALASATRAEDNETANCLPPGLPGIMTQPYPYEILVTPGRVTIISEAYTQVRHIYTDGRPLPQDPDPTFYGVSVGRWEDNSLVVETVGLADVPRGLSFPYSEKMKIAERFRLTDPDTLTLETTIIDPEALATPFVMPVRTFVRHRNWTLAEYVCEENNRNFVDEKGKAGLRLANPNASPR
ncbi:MAG: hypothetical protein C5B51_18670 [Terriglobia bacterium]|nr:MAG: hypothetical protein C5B51_18670 [Terriglobia bacterium]